MSTANDDRVEAVAAPGSSLISRRILPALSMTKVTSLCALIPDIMCGTTA